MWTILNKNKQGGYTIIETMIAVSIFIIIVVVGIGALLNANLIHNKSANIRSIMDNLTFIMEDMSRHLRTGYDYRCYYPGAGWNQNEANSQDLNEPRSCAEGGAIVFEDAYGDPSTNADQWVYKIDSQDGGQNYDIWKSTNGGTFFVKLNDESVKLKIDAQSGVLPFSVLGAEAPASNLTSGNLQQPLVTIKLKGEIQYKDTVTNFGLQTSVTQRLIDITP